MPSPAYELNPTSDALQDEQQGTPVKDMAYGNTIFGAIDAQTETRLQHLERGQKFIRRGKVVVAAPKGKVQRIMAATSASNPFATTSATGTLRFSPGTVPDYLAPATTAAIQYPLPNIL